MSEKLSIKHKPPQNFNDRLIGPPEMIVIHQLEETPKNTDNFSVHYFVHKNGSVDQFIAENYCALNAANSYWHGRYIIEDWSIAIGLEGAGANSTEMILALISLVHDIQSRHSRILNTAIVSYYDIAIERQNLIIPNIPWIQLAQAGIGITPQKGSESFDNIPSDFGEMILNTRAFLKEIGYYITSQTSTVADSMFTSALKAFQVRYLPHKVTGSIDEQTYAILQHVRHLYVTEYAKEWQNRVQKLSFNSNLSVNSSFQSSNFNRRLLGPPFMIVIHDTEVNFEASLKILTDSNRENPVSAHYLIDLSGTIYRLVDDIDRAWHAGVSYWHGFKELNDISIGIELVNTDSSKNSYPEEQITALINLLNDIRSRFCIPQHFIVSHEDIAPTRRSDPGPHFPWQKLVDSGLSIDSTEQLSSVTYAAISHTDYVMNIRRMLKQIGYLIEPQGCSTIDKELIASLQRFQWRFSPTHTEWNLSEVNMTLYGKMKAVADVYIKSYARN